MIYQTRRLISSRKKTSFIFSFLVVFLVSILFIFSAQPYLLNWFSPVLSSGNLFYDSLFLVAKIFTSKEDLIAKNEKMSQELERFNVALLDYESLKSENSRLNSELGLRPPVNFIGAKIIAKPPQTKVDSLLVDKGAKDGVKKGDLVLVGERVLIGRIEKVFDRQSLVTLNSLAEQVVYGYLERTGEFLEVKGVGGGNMEAKVPIDFSVEIGDLVSFEGTRSYLFGKVSLIEEDEPSGFKEIIISLPANISRTRIVFIEPSI